MSSSLAKLACWSAGHHGVITTDRLRATGLDAKQVHRLCANGTLVRKRRGVFVVAAAPASELQRVAIACVATGGTASWTTAGRYWELRRVPADPRVHVTLRRSSMSRNERLEGVRIHRCLELPPTDVVRCGDGIRVTSPPRTLFDLAAIVDADALESMIEQVIDRGMCGVPTLWGVARRLARRGRAGSTRFVDVLASRHAWRKPSGSADELTLERMLVTAGLPRPERQFAVRLPGGRTVHPDLVWPEARLAVEVDHVTWHGGRIDSTYDKWRDRQMRLLGWEVDRVTDADIRKRPVGTVRDLRALYVLRSSLA